MIILLFFNLDHICCSSCGGFKGENKTLNVSVFTFVINTWSLLFGGYGTTIDTASVLQ